MLLIRTQNKALINATDFKSMSIEQDDNQNTVIVCDGYILGYYEQDKALSVLNWIAETIASNTEKNVSIMMPQESDIEG